MRFSDLSGFVPMLIRPEHVFSIRTLRQKPDRVLSNQDPFDRLLIAQAKAEQCKLLSHDTNFVNYDEDCIVMI